jgi:hypothetical protein
MVEDGQPRDGASDSVEKIRRIVRESTAHEAPEMPAEYRYLDEQRQQQEIKLKKQYAKQEMALRRNYATSLLIILAVQIAAADVVFCVFAGLGKHWHLSDGVIQIWLAAAVVEVIGVVAVVTRHLFPRRDGFGDSGRRGLPVR